MVGPKFKPQHPGKKLSVVSVPIISVHRGRDGRIPWTHWPKQFSQMVNTGFQRDPVSKHKVDGD